MLTLPSVTRQMCDRKRITGVIYVRYVVTHFQIRRDHDDPDDPLTIYEELSDEVWDHCSSFTAPCGETWGNTLR